MNRALRSAVFGLSVWSGALVALPAAAQTADFAIGEMTRGAIVRDAPYSAEAVTSLKQTLGDGTHIERRSTAKTYRDRAGRVRREQTVIGLESLTPLSDALAIVTILDPVEGVTYVLDARLRIASRTPMDQRGRNIVVAPPPPPPPPPAPAPRQAGSDRLARQIERQRLFDDVNRDGLVDPLVPFSSDWPSTIRTRSQEIEGLMSTGATVTATIPAGAVGNDRDMVLTLERWESVDLKVIVLSRNTDPRTGVLEYRLTNITRAEPPADLFRVPTGYRVVDGPPLPPPPPPMPVAVPGTARP
jgi:hypothetical protein